YGQCGNLTQDIAAIKSLELLTKEYLDRFEFQDIAVTTAFHQWMGRFPQDEAKAFALIAWGAATAVLSGATKIIVKSPHEAHGVPTKEANAAGLKATKQLITMLAHQQPPLSCEIQTEMDLIMDETRSILNASLRLGDNNIADAVTRGFEAGIIDVPFAPSKYNPGKMMPIKDITGAIRFLEFGEIPFPEDIKEFHKQKVKERVRYEKIEAGFQMVIADVNTFSFRSAREFPRPVTGG